MYESARRMDGWTDDRYTDDSSFDYLFFDFYSKKKLNQIFFEFEI